MTLMDLIPVLLEVGVMEREQKRPAAPDVQAIRRL